MKTKPVTSWITIAAYFAAAVLPLATRAATNDAATDRSDPVQTAMTQDDFAGRAEGLAMHYQVRILVDPDIPAAPANAPQEEAALTDALDRLARQSPGVAWRRLYVNKDAAIPTPAKLAAAVRALEHLPQRGLAVENPGTRRALLFLPGNRQSAPAVSFQESAGATKPLYLFYLVRGTTDGLTAAERLTELQDQYLELLARLPASQRPNPVQIGFQTLQNLDAAQREAFLRRAVAAGTQAWDSADAPARDEMVQQFIQTAQQTVAAAQNPGNGGSDDSNAGVPQNHFDELRRMADGIAKRFRVRIVVEPGLWIAETPTMPATVLPLDQALDTLMEAVKSITWRRLYFTPTTAAALPPKTVAGMVRTLERSYQTDLGIEGPAAQGTTLLKENKGSASLPEALLRNRFAPTPTYLVHARRESSGEAIPAGQRLAELQQQQTDLLIHSSVDQLAQMMTAQVEQYHTLSASGQSGVMHLPLSAVLMAVWMPRKAQENGTGAPP